MDIVEIKQEPKELIECFMPFENVGGDAPLEHSKDEDLFRVGFSFFLVIDIKSFCSIKVIS